MKVLISGGGIAGNALAFWLSRLGHTVTVIERFDSLRTTGLQIDLRGHGIEVLKRMGLEQAFRSKAAPEQGWQIVNSSGKRRAYFPANTSGKGPQGFTSEYEIMRGDLITLIHEANQGRVEYFFGVKIEEYEQDGTSVKVHFTNTKVLYFDLLVGADGQWSHTRRMMLGKGTPDTMHPISGQYTGYFTMARPIQKGEQYLATFYMTPGQKGIMTRRHNADQIQVYLGCRTSSSSLKDARRGDVEAEKEALTQIFRGGGWQTQEILDALKVSEDFYCERLGVVKMDSWSKGCVVLLGDAAYCPSANTGMGTTSAVVGAYVLAGEISERCDTVVMQEQSPAAQERNGSLIAALQAYDARFRPFMDQVQRGVVEDKGWMPDSSFGVAMFNGIASLASFLKIDISSMFLKEAVKDWDLPVYEEMLRRL